jgi:hypothetical protein
MEAPVQDLFMRPIAWGSKNESGIDVREERREFHEHRSLSAYRFGAR